MFRSSKTPRSTRGLLMDQTYHSRNVLVYTTKYNKKQPVRTSDQFLAGKLVQRFRNGEFSDKLSIEAIKGSDSAIIRVDVYPGLEIDLDKIRQILVATETPGIECLYKMHHDKRAGTLDLEFTWLTSDRIITSGSSHVDYEDEKTIWE